MGKGYQNVMLFCLAKSGRFEVCEEKADVGVLW